MIWKLILRKKHPFSLLKMWILIKISIFIQILEFIICNCTHLLLNLVGDEILFWIWSAWVLHQLLSIFINLNFIYLNIDFFLIIWLLCVFLLILSCDDIICLIFSCLVHRSNCSWLHFVLLYNITYIFIS